jgi:hypothetical protein
MDGGIMDPNRIHASPDLPDPDDGSSSALFLALQNPTLSQAASVLLRAMQETGSISADDATLMSAFLSSCDLPQPGGGAAAAGGAGGDPSGNKRARDYDYAARAQNQNQNATADPGDEDGDGDDDIWAAAAARTVTGQIPDSEWVSHTHCMAA